MPAHGLTRWAPGRRVESACIGASRRASRRRARVRRASAACIAFAVAARSLECEPRASRGDFRGVGGLSAHRAPGHAGLPPRVRRPLVAFPGAAGAARARARGLAARHGRWLLRPGGVRLAARRRGAVGAGAGPGRMRGAPTRSARRAAVPVVSRRCDSGWCGRVGEPRARRGRPSCRWRPPPLGPAARASRLGAAGAAASARCGPGVGGVRSGARPHAAPGAARGRVEAALGAAGRLRITRRAGGRRPFGPAALLSCVERESAAQRRRPALPGAPRGAGGAPGRCPEPPGRALPGLVEPLVVARRCARVRVASRGSVSAPFLAGTPGKVARGSSAGSLSHVRSEVAGERAPPLFVPGPPPAPVHGVNHEFAD